jgi:hypothetical protein
MALTIDQLNIQIAADSANASRALTSLIKKLEQLKGALTGTNVSNITISNSFNKTTNSINKATTATTKHANAVKKSSKSTKSFSDNLAQQISKWRTLYGVFNSAAQTMGSWFKESNDYIETLNLFNVTMGSAAPAARKYAEAVEKAIGIDSKDFMQFQGVFKNLTAGFGASAEDANKMSQNLTQLSYDMASFFNSDVEEAFDKLSSAMSGQVKGLREYGIDTTVATLQEYALSKGIQTKVRNMSQAEKAMLRYNYIMEQSTHIQGDMARTLITPANALRVLESQLTRMKRAFGDIISVIVARFIPYIQAMVEIVTDAAKALANFFGFELPDIELPGIELGENFEDADDALDDVSGSIKKIKKQLMGFDELNIISNPDTGGGGGSAGGGSGGLGNMELLEYDFLKDLDTSKIDEVKQKLKDILSYLPIIAAGLAAFNVAKLITGLLVVKGLMGGLTAGAIVIGATLAITGFAIEFKGIKDAIKNGLSKFNFGEIVGGALLGTGGATILGTTLVTWLGKIGSTKLVFAFAELGRNLGVASTAALGAALGAGIGGIIAGIPMFITGIYDAIKNGLNWLNSVLIPAGATAAGAGIGVIIGMLGGPIGAGIGALIGLAVGLVTDLVILIVENWDAIVSWCSNACAAIGQFFVDLWNGIVAVWNTVAEWFNTWVIQPVANFFVWLWITVSGFFVNLWDGIVAIWNTVAEWFNTWVVQPVINFFVGLWTGISNAASACWNAIVAFFTPAVEWFSALFSSIWQTISDIFYNIGVIAQGCWEIIVRCWEIASEWFNQYVIQPVVKFFSDLWADISTWAINAWETIKNTFSAIGTWIDTNVIQPVGQFFVNLWSGFSTWAINSWENIKTAFSKIGSWIYSNIIEPVGNFFSNLWSGFKEGAKKAWEGVKSVFSTVGNFFKETFEKAWNGIVKVFSIAGEIFVDIKDGIVSAFKFVVNGIIKGLNKVVSIPFNGINNTLMWLKDLEILGIQPFSNLKSISVPQIPLLAEGGIVNAGQMFIAREAGPELVGSIGNKTAVANNDQIVSGIESGVYRAMVAANSTNRGGSQTIRIINEIDGDVVGEKVIQYHNGKVIQTGASPLLI